MLDQCRAAKTCRCNMHSTTTSYCPPNKSSDRCVGQLQMRTKLLVGSALLLWLFGIARPRYGYFCSRPFGWVHG